MPRLVFDAEINGDQSAVMAQNIDWDKGVISPPKNASSSTDPDWNSGVLTPPPPKRSLVAALNDTVIEAANSAAGTVSAAFNFASPGNAASQWIDKNIIEAGEAAQSDVVKAEKARYVQEMQQAQGMGDEVSATLGYAARNPLLAAAQAAGSFAIPGLGVSKAKALAGIAGLGAKGASRAGLAAGAGLGAAAAGGDAAGTAYELSREGGATDEQAVAAARGASLIPAAIGAAGALVGAERLVAGAKGFGGGVVSRALKTGAVEGVQEAIEEGVTQYEGQRAAVPFNPELDPSKGVAGAATLGGVLGGTTGAGTSLLTRQNHSAARKPSEDLGLDPDNGPVSKLAVSAVDEGRAAAPVQAAPDTIKDELSLVPRDEDSNSPAPSLEQHLQVLPANVRAQAEQLLREIADERNGVGVKRFRANELQELLDEHPMPQEPSIAIPEVDQVGLNSVNSSAAEGLAPSVQSADAHPATGQAINSQFEGARDSDTVPLNAQLLEQPQQDAQTPAVSEPVAGEPHAQAHPFTQSNASQPGQNYGATSPIDNEPQTDAPLQTQSQASTPVTAKEIEGVDGAQLQQVQPGTEQVSAMQTADSAAHSLAQNDLEASAVAAQSPRQSDVPVQAMSSPRASADQTQSRAFKDWYGDWQNAGHEASQADSTPNAAQDAAAGAVDVRRLQGSGDVGAAVDSRYAEVPIAGGATNPDGAQGIAPEDRAALRVHDAAPGRGAASVGNTGGALALPGVQREAGLDTSTGVRAAHAGKVGQDATFTGTSGPTGPDGSPLRISQLTFSGSSGPTGVDGAPLPLNHGTREDITAFDLNHPTRKDHGWLGQGVYLASDPVTASEYAQRKMGKHGSSVMPVYANVRNPYVATQAQKDRIKAGGTAASQAFTERLKAMGHDGVVLDLGEAGIELVAFEPTQIKSTTGNNGNFDGVNPDIRFSLSAKVVTKPTAIKLRRAMVQRTVNSLSKAWAQAPDIIIVDSMQDAQVPESVRAADALQRSQGAQGEPEGFWHEGKVYLVANALSSSADAARVLYHEVLGHHGLKGFFGPDLDKVLVQVAKMRPRDLEAKALGYGLDLNNPDHVTYAAEEVLAEMAQTRPDIGFVQRAIAAIRNFLRTHVPGFNTLELTDADIVQGYLLPARRWVEKGGASTGLELSQPGRDVQFHRSNDLENARLIQGAAVASVDTSIAPMGAPAIRSWAADLFAQQGGKAHHPELGDVVLDARAVRSSLAHGRPNAHKVAAFAAVKDVIEKGALIASAKHGATTSFYVSAPVKLSGADHILTALVRRDVNTQRMYLHSVATKESLLNHRVSSADADASRRSGSNVSGDDSNIASVTADGKFDRQEVARELQRLLQLNLESVPLKVQPYLGSDSESLFSRSQSFGHQDDLQNELKQSPAWFGSTRLQLPGEYRTMQGLQVRNVATQADVVNDGESDNPMFSRSQPADGYVRLYHGGGEGVTGIKEGGSFNRFDGLFTSDSRESAASHGTGYLYSMDVAEERILTQRELDYEIDHQKLITTLHEVMPWLENEDSDIAFKAVVEDQSHLVEPDELVRVFREEDVGSASWEAQRIRGQLAKKLGFQAVEMNDEHGISYLVLPGVPVKAVDDNSSIDSARQAQFSRSQTGRAINSSMGVMTPEQERAYKAVAGLQQVPTVKERVQSFKANLGLRMKQALVDQFAPIAELDQHAYMMARMSKGSDGTLEAALMYGKPFLRDGVPDVDIKEGGFAKILASLKGEQDRFLMWAAALRAEILKTQGKENLFTDQDITSLKTLNDGLMQDGSSRKETYAKALMQLNSFNESVLRMAKESGLIDQDAYDLMKDQPYVPFYRLMEEDGGLQGPSFSKGLTNQKAWKKLKGGTQQLNADLLQNLLLNWGNLYAASARNRAALATMDAAEKMAVAYKVSSDTKGAAKVMRDGMVEHWMVEDPYLLEAISALNYQASPLMKPLAKAKQWLTWGVTVNPTFKVRNLIRDVMSSMAMADLSYNPAANVAKGWKLTARDSQVYASMLAAGGVIKFGTQEQTERARKQVAKLSGVTLDQKGVKKLWGQLKSLYEVYDDLGDRTENVNRAALYDRLIAKGHSHAEASFMARDLMDFSMGGSAPVVRFLTQSVPFLNARLQGLYKLGRSAKEDPRRFATVAMAVSVASLGLLAAYADDEDWKRREDWDRDSYWWFKIGETAYRIPKPFEVGAIGTLAERTAEAMFSEEMDSKRFLERISHMVSQTFAFDPMPQAFKPLLDIYANKDSFTGRAIESLADQRLRPQDRYSEKTTEVARFLGQLGLPDPAQLVKGEYSGLSPKQIDHLLRAYFSWAATAVTTATDYPLRALADRGDRPDMRLKDAFLLGNFVESLPTGSSRYVSAMYEQSRQVEQAFASYRAALSTGDIAGAAQILESDGDKIKSQAAVSTATKLLSQLNQQAKRIESDPSLNGTEKRERLNQIEQRRHAIAQRVKSLSAT